jgi:hypothetical protein
MARSSRPVGVREWRAQFVAVGAMATGLTTEPLLMRGPQTHGGGTFAKIDTSGDLNINVKGAASVSSWHGAACLRPHGDQGRQPPTKVLLRVLQLETVYVPIKKPDAKAD